MKTLVSHKKQTYRFDLSQPIDISIPIRHGKNNVSAWYLSPPEISPVKTDNWIGSVAEGADVNFNNITFNPHAHGTHTECVGHITEEVYNVANSFTRFFFVAHLITLAPGKIENDYVISRTQIKNALKGKTPEALIIRTLPNSKDKLNRKYDNTNPPYLLEEAAIFIRELKIKHLLIDLPSVDKEKDEGKLLAHKAFWNEEEPLTDRTITEFIYVPNRVKDGLYMLNIQPGPFINDAAPSRPILYKADIVER